MKGRPITLLGPALNVGDVAPDFRVVDQGFHPVRLAEFHGRPCLISAVPSLDTSVCALQTKRFNAEVASLPDEVVALTISMDLPFAQKRFCDAETIECVHVLSDHVWREFGERYGLFIKDMGLLARAVFIIARDGRISYIQIVPEISQHPDYDAALKALKAVL
ncbi:MAG: thiol peroxidase [Candidatus Eisenbacteria bacterium]